jgi:hypothetical protein
VKRRRVPKRAAGPEAIGDYARSARFGQGGRHPRPFGPMI